MWLLNMILASNWSKYQKGLGQVLTDVQSLGQHMYDFQHIANDFMSLTRGSANENINKLFFLFL